MRVTRTSSGQPPARRSFTLIELLVVVAIIAILAAILLPALRSAKDNAIRISCLSDRRQNGLSIFNYGSDFDGRVPSATAQQDANGYEGLTPSEQIHWHGATSAASPASWWFPQASQTHEGTTAGVVFAMGTLIRFKYVGDSATLYCPGWNRTESMAPNSHYTGDSIKLDKDSQSWRQMIKGELTFSPRYRHYLGICHQLFSEGAAPGVYDSQPNTRLDWIARNWKNNNKVSSVLVGCAQYDFYNHGTTAGDSALSTDFGFSHKGKGSNAVFYDGSARWVSVTELQKCGWQASTNVSTGVNWAGSLPKVYLFNRTATHNAAADNFVMWGRNGAEPGG